MQPSEVEGDAGKAHAADYPIPPSHQCHHQEDNHQRSQGETGEDCK